MNCGLSPIQLRDMTLFLNSFFVTSYITKKKVKLTPPKKSSG